MLPTENNIDICMHIQNEKSTIKDELHTTY